jgi:hypothetical protein
LIVFFGALDFWELQVALEKIDSPERAFRSQSSVVLLHCLFRVAALEI